MIYFFAGLSIGLGVGFLVGLFAGYEMERGSW